MFKRISIITILTIIVAMIIAIPVYAIDNPDDIQLRTYKVFENASVDGDMLFVAEIITDYTVEPTDYLAGEAFIFEILNVAGNETLYSKPINAYGDRPMSFYLTPTQVTSSNISSGDALILKVRGNPLIFASETGNTDNHTLSDDDYVDQSIGADSEIPSENNLRNYLILMAIDIEDYDTPTDEYVEDVQGYKYLTNTGGDIFIEGIPGLTTLCPILFQYGSREMSADVPESTGAYAEVLTPLNKWGQTTADGLTNIGVFLGVNQALAGSVVLFVLVIMLAVFVYRRTQSGITVMLMVSSAPLIGGYLGLMPIALAFVFVIFIMVLMGYFFFSRGAL